MVKFTCEIIWSLFCLFVFTDSISLLVIGLFKLSIHSWFNFGELYVSRKLSVSFRLSNLLAYNSLCMCCVLSHVWFFVTHDCSPPGSSVHEIFQARILEWLLLPTEGQGIFPTRGSNLILASLCLLYYQVDSLPLTPPGKPIIDYSVLLWLYFCGSSWDFFFFTYYFAWVLCLFFLVNLARGLLILFTLSKNQLLVCLFFSFF